MRLVSPAGTLPALKAAVDNGADDIYLGFRDATNARNFAGLNFDDKALAEGVRYAHARGRHVLVALNTFPQPGQGALWRRAVDRAVEFGADALIVADMGLMDYARRTHPQVRLHLSVQASATSYEAINFYRSRFGIARAVLPRVLSLAQVEQVVANTPVQIEVFGFGSLCIMVEGRCALSSYVTGESPNTQGACSPAWAIRWAQTPAHTESRLNGVLVDRFRTDEATGYPTRQAARAAAGGLDRHRRAARRRRQGSRAVHARADRGRGGSARGARRGRAVAAAARRGQRYECGEPARRPRAVRRRAVAERLQRRDAGAAAGRRRGALGRADRAGCRRHRHTAAGTRRADRDRGDRARPASARDVGALLSPRSPPARPTPTRCSSSAGS